MPILCSLSKCSIRGKTLRQSFQRGSTSNNFCGSTNTLLINFSTVEWHNDVLVLRQFGSIQHVPDGPQMFDNVQQELGSRTSTIYHIVERSAWEAISYIVLYVQLHAFDRVPTLVRGEQEAISIWWSVYKVLPYMLLKLNVDNNNEL